MTLAQDRARLIRALAARRDIDDWTVHSTATTSARRAWRDAAAGTAGETRAAGAGAGDARNVGAAAPAGEERGLSERAVLWAELHRDQGAGRGSATLALAADGDAERAVERAIVRADAAIGPGWRTPSPAAPARVELDDPAIAGAPADRPGTAGAPADTAALAAAVDVVARELAAAVHPATIAHAEVEVALDDLALSTRRGQRASWRATRITVRATVRHAGVTVDFTREARRVADLDLTAAGRAAIVAAEAADAPPPPAATVPVALRAAALVHGGRGLLDAIVAQADPDLERQGLVRYRPGQPIAPGATLSLESDGTLPFGRWSAPLGDRGEPVRRFPLVTRGVAAGLGLDARAAALRGAQPNGGVRGLVVPPGDVAAAELVTEGTLVVDELAWLEVERATGWFRAEIASGELWSPGPRSEPLPDGGAAMGHRGGRRIRGGILRGDAIALLARARRSLEIVVTPTYRGPALWLLGPLAID